MNGPNPRHPPVPAPANAAVHPADGALACSSPWSHHTIAHVDRFPDGETPRIVISSCAGFQHEILAAHEQIVDPTSVRPLECAFPNRQHPPSSVPKCLERALIPLPRFSDLLLPKRRSSLRPHEHAAIIPMPETTIDEYDLLDALEIPNPVVRTSPCGKGGSAAPEREVPAGWLAPVSLRASYSGRWPSRMRWASAALSCGRPQAWFDPAVETSHGSPVVSASSRDRPHWPPCQPSMSMHRGAALRRNPSAGPRLT